MTTTIDKPRVSKAWRKILCALPGYDPFDQAGDCWFDHKSAELALDFFPECLVHVKGPLARQPIDLELWQKSIIANVFGWKRPDGTRRYREAFVFVPRKNGKTTLVGGIVLFVMLCDNEAGAEIYSSANDREQAKLVFVPVKAMALASDVLKERTKPYQHSILEIDPETGLETGTFYKPISAEANTKHGYNGHLIINDEIHAHRDGELLDVLETSTGARTQPLIIHITTSDFDRPSICNEKLDYAEKVRDNVIEDPSFLPAIYAADPEDDWKDPKVWAKANPNLGVSLSREYFVRQFKKAVQTPRYENTFKRLHLNIKTEQAVRWLTMDVWDKCNTPVVEDDLVGKPCFAGFDLASNKDLAGYVLLFPPDDDCDLYRVVCRLYIPEDNARRREEKDKVPYIAWSKENLITLTPGNVVDYGFIKAQFERDCERFDLQEAAFDRWGFEALRQQFIHDGIDEEKFIAFGQGYASMSAPTKEFEKLLLSGKIAHGGHKVLRWNAANVAVEEDSAENLKPSKKKSFEKIDGIVMTIMALGRAIIQGEPEASVYETRGITRI